MGNETTDFTHLLMRNNVELEHVKKAIDQNFVQAADKYSDFTRKIEDIYHTHYKDKEAVLDRISKLENAVNSEMKRSKVFIGMIEVAISTIIATIIGILIKDKF